MKRIVAGVLAVATACSLSTGVANAKTSSEVTQEELLAYVLLQGVKDKVNPGDGFTSSLWALPENNYKKIEDNPLHSSYLNDTANGYKLGTTFDILLGTGIAATVLAAIAAAIQSGAVKLPF
ncbi:Uncharacterised protein [Corynebacterium renale]|uniref:hypothetical protein n=1 Tax=Corynebacterium renale TaxID=1724 RepID=UPI000DA3AB00|nr:hypothetical protein [Corynebacterium renale]SQG63540.1 Uncharacterised protein [Corynebacterium renale]STD00738.1 Uncharacterised protein [Corynebacterium renale]